ncbi:hypothetical protein H0H81_000143 [Sphagnurus paluster]|uniref:DUF8191 domain-containing protein n=1 Tax=Sphagnurus paluster TaxID=117069 RepID=A0A9P7K4L6_9AGAR|nr:hypothetical protein H0H81_000143 [Sphagnurus paluster]
MRFALSDLGKRVAELETYLVQVMDDASETTLDTENDTENLEFEEEDEPNLPEALHDVSEGIYRCTECNWEVVHGVCANCEMEFAWENVNSPFPSPFFILNLSFHPQEEHEALLPADTLYTDTLPSAKSDRAPAPRGHTPLLTLPENTTPFPGYIGSHSSYYALLERGATPRMIEVFSLQFSYSEGICAWADEDLREEFSGPAMCPDDRWKICLGRRIELEAGDEDGAAFIAGLLEDALLFPLGEKERWETVLESPRVWVTRMKRATGQEDGQGDDDYDDYEDEEEDIDEAIDGATDASLPFADDGPVLLRPGYDTSDDYDSADEVADTDEGSAIRASVPDAEYAGGTHSQEHSDSDSADSDYDEDELFSGDEGLMEAVPPYLRSRSPRWGAHAYRDEHE